MLTLSVGTLLVQSSLGVWRYSENVISGTVPMILVKGSKPYTGGCISFDEDRMVEILKNCDMSLVIKVIE